MWLLCFMSSILPFTAEENCVTWKLVDVGLLYKSCIHYNDNFRWFSVFIIFFFLLRNIQVFLFNHVCTCERAQWPQRVEEALTSPGAGARCAHALPDLVWLWAAWSGCWELNSVPPLEQYVQSHLSSSSFFSHTPKSVAHGRCRNSEKYRWICLVRIVATS